MPKYSRKSKTRLNSCIDPLQDLFNAVIKNVDHSIISGLRDEQEQNKLFKNNASKVKFPNSRHNGQAPDYKESWAVDAAPYPMPKGWGDINAIARKEISLQWKERVKFYEFAAIVRYEWSKLKEKNKSYRKYQLTWGGDWDRDGQYTDNTFDDLVHFQMDLVEEKINLELSSSEEEEGSEENE